MKRELPFVRRMFNGIAPRYDFLNRFLSLRRDVLWRRRLVTGLNLQPGAWILDAACGTADVGLEIHKQVGHSVHVVGIDFAVRMLQLAASKTRSPKEGTSIFLAAADAFQLPFENESFDAVSMAFGIRNIQNKETVLRRFLDCLKPGGQLAILELSTPTTGLLRPAYLYYFNRLLPLLGRFFSSHRFAYTYLPASVANFPAAEAFAALMCRVGFINVRYRKMTLGIAVLFTGEKPPKA